MLGVREALRARDCCESGVTGMVYVVVPELNRRCMDNRCLLAVGVLELLMISQKQ